MRRNNNSYYQDALIVRKPDNTVKLLVYRKKTHTDQYLSFDSHHPLHLKLRVVRTLLDRNPKFVTEQKDQEKEEEYIREALSVCGYPKWSVDKEKKQMKDKEDKIATKKPKKDQDTKKQWHGGHRKAIFNGLAFTLMLACVLRSLPYICELIY